MVGTELRASINLDCLRDSLCNGDSLGREEALALLETPLEQLRQTANFIREYFCGDSFDLCTIINGKSGKCPENCKFCAQSAHYKVRGEIYPLKSTHEILEDAKLRASQGILRYSIVTSGRRLTDREVDKLCKTYEQIAKRTNLSLCASHGLLTYPQFLRLKAAGVNRYHNNLETSRRFFPQVCTTHTYDQKIETIRAAQEAGMSVCSGGIMGLGEKPIDRIEMALELRRLGIMSIPINVLSPIPGTPFANHTPLSDEEVIRFVSIYRLMHPRAAIRLAGGRGQLNDKGRQAFESGANAAITGDMLTTAGISVANDKEILTGCGYQPKLIP